MKIKGLSILAIVSLLAACDTKPVGSAGKSSSAIKLLEDQLKLERRQVALLKASIKASEAMASLDGEMKPDELAHQMLSQMNISAGAVEFSTSVAHFIPASEGDLHQEIRNQVSSLNAEWEDCMRVYKNAVSDSRSDPKTLGMMATQMEMIEAHRRAIAKAGFEIK